MHISLKHGWPVIIVPKYRQILNKGATSSLRFLPVSSIIAFFALKYFHLILSTNANEKMR